MKKNNKILDKKVENYLYNEELINKGKKPKSTSNEPKKDVFQPKEILSPFGRLKQKKQVINNNFNAGAQTKMAQKNKKSDSGFVSTDDYVNQKVGKDIHGNKKNIRVDYDKVRQEVENKFKKKNNKPENLDPLMEFDPAIGNGTYSAKYFLKVSQVVKETKPHALVTFQVMHKSSNPVVACGINQVVELLKNFTNVKKLKVTGVKDGDLVAPKTPLLEITGPYVIFGYLESVILGFLRRMTSIATNCYRLKEAAGKTPVIFMGDRQDIYLNQPYDGFAAYTGGLRYFVTEAHLKFLTKELTKPALFASIPHCFIQLFEGDVIAATEAYLEVYPKANMIPLVDYNNDVVADAVKLAQKFGNRIYGVRVDTSGSLTDKYFTKFSFGHEPKLEKGVTVNLIKGLRQALDLEGYKDLKIIVSGGFNAQRVRDYGHSRKRTALYLRTLFSIPIFTSQSNSAFMHSRKRTLS